MLSVVGVSPQKWPDRSRNDEGMLVKVRVDSIRDMTIRTRLSLVMTCVDRLRARGERRTYMAGVYGAELFQPKPATPLPVRVPCRSKEP